MTPVLAWEQALLLPICNGSQGFSKTKAPRAKHLQTRLPIAVSSSAATLNCPECTSPLVAKTLNWNAHSAASCCDRKLMARVEASPATWTTASSVQFPTRTTWESSWTLPHSRCVGLGRSLQWQPEVSSRTLLHSRCVEERVRAGVCLLFLRGRGSERMSRSPYPGKSLWLRRHAARRPAAYLDTQASKVHFQACQGTEQLRSSTLRACACWALCSHVP